MRFMLYSAFVGLLSALIGTFYRNTLKGDGMLLNSLYYNVFERWVSNEGFLGFIARPLGYCIYCCTFWIDVILFGVLLLIVIPKWYLILFGFLLSEGVQHILVCIICKWLITDHIDLDMDYVYRRWNSQNRTVVTGFTKQEEEQEETSKTNNNDSGQQD